MWEAHIQQLFTLPVQCYTVHRRLYCRYISTHIKRTQFTWTWFTTGSKFRYQDWMVRWHYSYNAGNSHFEKYTTNVCFFFFFFSFCLNLFLSIYTEIFLLRAHAHTFICKSRLLSDVYVKYVYEYTLSTAGNSRSEARLFFSRSVSFYSTVHYIIVTGIFHSACMKQPLRKCHLSAARNTSG
jgi:hypothetical protein